MKGEQQHLAYISDIHLAAYLIISGFELKSLGTESQDRRRAFIFVETREMELAALKFVNGQALCDPKRYAEQLRSLKAMTRGYFPGSQERDLIRTYHGPRPGGKGRG